MTTIPLGRQRGQAIGSALAGAGRLGLLYPLLLVWLFFEFGRPPNPFKIPLAISLVSVIAWLLRSQKQWTSYTRWWFVVLGAAALGVPFAPNTYAAFWSTRDMAVLFLSICLPLQSLVTSVRRVRLWLFVFLAIALYVGGWAATHGGYGPSGADGGQDENYVAALMCLAVVVAYFSLFAESGRIARIVLAAVSVVFVAAIALGANPSRGGFIGLCAVALYCLARSPKKLVGISVFAVIAIALVAFAGPAFWTEIGTSTDASSGTGDARIEFWKAGFRMWQANPILGVGAGNFRWVIGDYQTAEQVAKFGRSLAGSVIAHSLWVEALAELGLLGVLATAVLVCRTWRDLGRIRDDAMRQTGGPSPDPELVRFRCYADALRGGILAILVNGLFLSLFYYSHLWLLLALGAGLTFHYQSRGLGSKLGAVPAPHPGVSPAGPRRGGAPLVPLGSRPGHRSLGRGRR